MILQNYRCDYLWISDVLSILISDVYVGVIILECGYSAIFAEILLFPSKGISINGVFFKR